MRKACFSQNSGWEKSSGLLVRNCQALHGFWLFLKNLETVTKMLHKKLKPFTANGLPLESFPANPLLHYPAWVVWGEGTDLSPGNANCSVIVCLASRCEGGCQHCSNRVNESRTQDSLGVSVVVSRMHFIDIGVYKWKSREGLISFFLSNAWNCLLKKQKHCWGCGNTTYDSIERAQIESDCRMCIGADKGVSTGLKSSYSATIE